MLDVTSDRVLAAPPGGFLSVIEQRIRPLRIAFSRSPMLGKTTHAEAMKAADVTADVLRQLGCTVEETTPEGINWESAARAFATLFLATIGRDVADVTNKRGGIPPRAGELETTSVFIAAFYRSLKEQELANALAEAARVSEKMAAFHQRYDVLLTPTLAAPPIRVGSLQPKWHERMAMSICSSLKFSSMFDMLIDELAKKSFAWLAYTPIANMTGQPSISLPLYWTAENVPVGSQLTAAVGREEILLCLAAELERECPWFDKRPPKA